MITVPVPVSWIYYVINPTTFQHILKRIDIPHHVPGEVRDKLMNVHIPLEAWTGYYDVEVGGSRFIYFVFDDCDEDFVAIFKLTYL